MSSKPMFNEIDKNAILVINQVINHSFKHITGSQATSDKKETVIFACEACNVITDYSLIIWS